MSTRLEPERDPDSGSPMGMPDVGLCLDFVNTEGSVRNNQPDGLKSLEDFGVWASSHGLRQPVSPPDDEGVPELLSRAKGFREALYRIFSALANGLEPPEEDLAPLNAWLTGGLGRLKLAWRGESFGWTLTMGATHTDEWLEVIALSAAFLLRSERLSRVKECDSETCSWVFIDESRNRSRRWCDMADCGNREKARRFYRRHARGGTAE